MGKKEAEIERTVKRIMAYNPYKEDPALVEDVAKLAAEKVQQELGDWRGPGRDALEFCIKQHELAKRTQGADPAMGTLAAAFAQEEERARFTAVRERAASYRRSYSFDGKAGDAIRSVDGNPEELLGLTIQDMQNQLFKASIARQKIDDLGLAQNEQAAGYMTYGGRLGDGRASQQAATEALGLMASQQQYQNIAVNSARSLQDAYNRSLGGPGISRPIMYISAEQKKAKAEIIVAEVKPPGKRAIEF